MKEEKLLISSCLKGNEAAFEALYNRFASKMMVVCNRYAQDSEHAKDLLQDGFIKVFQQLQHFRFEGSLEGWIRRVMVTTALENYRKTTKERENISLSSDFSEAYHPISAQDILSQVHFEELLQMIQELSPAYRMIFNLYVFEGMKHHEIASKLGISEGTSKSNLSDARKILQQRIERVMFDIK